MSVLQVLQAFTPFSEQELVTIAATAPLRYKVYEIPKRSGRGQRTIAHPAPEVKLLQRILVDKILYKLPVHACAVGYRKRRSTAAHVEPHLDSKFLLKLDFKDFFPSITAHDLSLHVQRHYPQFSAEDLRTVVRLLCWKNRAKGVYTLSIGAPSSPSLSNSVLFDFDTHISGACEALGVNYTRYADDLAFSTRKQDTLSKVQQIVQRVLNELVYPHLELNARKTLNVSKGYRRSLVGLVLTPTGQISLGRETKRRLHAGVFNALLGKLGADQLTSLRGHLAYAWSVEPSFIVALVGKYGRGAMELLELPFGEAANRGEEAA